MVPTSARPSGAGQARLLAPSPRPAVPGVFRFTLALPPGGGCAFPAAAVLGEDGSCGSLGHVLAPFPNIADADLAAAVNTVANYAGAPCTPGANG
jgi:hypothetical protein